MEQILPIALQLAKKANTRSVTENIVVTLHDGVDIKCEGIKDIDDQTIKTMNATFFYYSKEIVELFYNHTNCFELGISFEEFIQTRTTDDLAVIAYGVILSSFDVIDTSKQICTNPNCEEHYVDNNLDVSKERLMEIISEKAFEVEIKSNKIKLDIEESWDLSPERKSTFEEQVKIGDLLFTFGYSNLERHMEIEKGISNSQARENLKNYNSVLPRSKQILYSLKRIESIDDDKKLIITKPLDIEMCLKAFDASTKDKVFKEADRISKILSKYNTNFSFDYECPNCGKEHTLELDLILQFFRKALTIFG